MKKILLIPLISLILCSCSNNYYYHEAYDGIHKKRQETSLLVDGYYRNGFNLTNVDNVNPIFRDWQINYGGSADDESDTIYGWRSYWSLCQWWAPEEMDFINANYEKKDNLNIYQNADRYFSVDTGDGEVKLALNAYNEYQSLFGGPRPRSANWSHHLIEQHFPESSYITVQELIEQNKNVYVSYDVKVDKCEFLGEKWLEGDTAQLLCYLTVSYAPIGSDGKRHRFGGFPTTIWFGVPVLDIRYPHTDTYISVDSGQAGATDAFVYALDSSLYIDDEFRLNKTYKVDLALAQYIKQAYETGISRHFLNGTNWEDMAITYASFGWEITGEYDCSCILNNFDVYVK